MAKREVVTNVVHGMGSTCQATSPELQVSRRLMRKLIKTVAAIEQPNDLCWHPAFSLCRGLSAIEMGTVHRLTARLHLERSGRTCW